MNTKKILLIDDDQFVLGGLKAFLESKEFLVTTAENYTDAHAALEVEIPDVMVIDISLPYDRKSKMSRPDKLGIRLATEVKKKHPALGVVLFSAYDDYGVDFFGLLNKGVRGLAYQLKGNTPQSLLTTIENVQTGRVIFDEGISQTNTAARSFLEQLTEEEREAVQLAVEHIAELTAREREIAELLANSSTRKHISETLHLVLKSVDSNISNIYSKLYLREDKMLNSPVLLTKTLMYYDLLNLS